MVFIKIFGNKTLIRIIIDILIFILWIILNWFFKKLRLILLVNTLHWLEIVIVISFIEINLFMSMLLQIYRLIKYLMILFVLIKFFPELMYSFFLLSFLVFSTIFIKLIIHALILKIVLFIYHHCSILMMCLFILYFGIHYFLVIFLVA